MGVQERGKTGRKRGSSKRQGRTCRAADAGAEKSDTSAGFSAFSYYLCQREFCRKANQGLYTFKHIEVEKKHSTTCHPAVKPVQQGAIRQFRLYRHANTLGQKPKKIAMIMHADGGVSNGNVALAPRKSELYTMPSQEPGDAWLEHLCTHEFRHVVQFDKINQGLTHGLYYLFGEIFPIAVVGVYLPMWFLEGDAVCFETSVGHVGRGRSPEFLGEMKAQMVEKGIYSFPKAILGSQKDYVPNRYNMGYFMTANTRRHYGSARQPVAGTGIQKPFCQPGQREGGQPALRS